MKEVPNLLFDRIIGYEELKHWIIRSLTSPKPVHVLLVGPPGLAKSLFATSLEGLRDYGWSVLLVQGPTTSKPALRDELIAKRPDILIIDSFDKLPRDCMDLLLEPMEHGRLTVLKKVEGYRGWIHQSKMVQLNVRVYAFANSLKGITKALVDRFEIYQVQEYSLDQYIKVAVEVLTKFEGVEPKLAHYIAERTANELHLRNIRGLRNIGRMCKTEEEVDAYITFKLKHGGQKQKTLIGYVESKIDKKRELKDLTAWATTDSVDT